jgi:S1-C subfamily serine protease
MRLRHPTIRTGQNKLGMAVRDVTPATASKLGRRRSCHRRAPGQLCRPARSHPGLVITRINKQPTSSTDQFNKVVSGLKSGQDVVFEVMDPKHPVLLPVGMPIPSTASQPQPKSTKSMASRRSTLTV